MNFTAISPGSLNIPHREKLPNCMHVQISNKLFTWLPVSMQLKCELVVVFQKRIHRSAVPPPDARSPWRWGDHAIAFTAAVCSQYLSTGWVECWFQTKSCIAHYWLWIGSMTKLECTKHKSDWKKNFHNIPYYHSRQMPAHGYHKTTSVRKPKGQSYDLQGEKYENEKKKKNGMQDTWTITWQKTNGMLHEVQIRRTKD